MHVVYEVIICLCSNSNGHLFAGCRLLTAFGNCLESGQNGQNAKFDLDLK